MPDYGKYRFWLEPPKTLQLGLALPLERAAGQSNQTNNPSKNEVGWM